MHLLYLLKIITKSLCFKTNAQRKNLISYHTNVCVSGGAELDMSMLSIICSPNLYFAKIAVGRTTRIR